MTISFLNINQHFLPDPSIQYLWRTCYILCKKIKRNSLWSQEIHIKMGWTEKYRNYSKSICLQNPVGTQKEMLNFACGERLQRWQWTWVSKRNQMDKDLLDSAFKLMEAWKTPTLLCMMVRVIQHGYGSSKQKYKAQVGDGKRWRRYYPTALYTTLENSLNPVGYGGH